MTKRVLPLFLFAMALAAEDATKPPLPVTRTPAAAPLVAPTDKEVKALGDELTALQKQLKAQQDAPAISPVRHGVPPTSPASTEVPAGWKPSPPKLAATASVSAELSSTWANAPSMPAAGRDGKVVFPFGATLPVVWCTPLRVCAIELEAGERITAEPALGDSVRWDVSPRTSGRYPAETTLVIVKPRAVDLDTNMILTTDRRVYYLRLVSDKEKYLTRVAFEYPESTSADWKHVIEDQQANAAAAAVPVSREAPGGELTNANFHYAVTMSKKGDENIRPVSIYDIGGKTIIVMPKNMLDRDAPVLLIHTNGGKDEQCNYRISGDTYIVDRLFDQAALVLGVGKTATRVDIVRQKG